MDSGLWMVTTCTASPIDRCAETDGNVAGEPTGPRRPSLEEELLARQRKARRRQTLNDLSSRGGERPTASDVLMKAIAR